MRRSLWEASKVPSEPLGAMPESLVETTMAGIKRMRHVHEQMVAWMATQPDGTERKTLKTAVSVLNQIGRASCRERVYVLV